MTSVIELSKYLKSTSTGRISHILSKNGNIRDKICSKDGNFVDSTRVTLQAGNGGSGGCSFGPPTRTGHGKPTGGNGGIGGSIYLSTDPTLLDLRHVPKHFAAASGGRGGKEYSTGHGGEDSTIHVPLGTLVHVLDYKEANLCNLADKKEESSCLAYQNTTIDMNEIDMIVKVAQGGRGGRGNADFGKQNREYELGWNGACALLHLDLKTIATAGLVGFPNAGKSSFLAAISNAKPTIAPYPFTTLKPSLGKFKEELFRSFGNFEREIFREFTIADIPGLVEGAHMNIGLGHSFLKHISRCSLLIYIIDLTASNPFKTFKTLRDELNMYDRDITKRPSIVLGNKCDVGWGLDDSWIIFREQIEKEGLDAVQISCKNGRGIHDAVDRILDLYLSQICKLSKK